MKRILVVDDEPTGAKLTSARLMQAGYDVTLAANGEEGLALINQKAPDLVILDLALPKLSGYEVCMLMKNNGRLKRIPVVMLTAKTKEQDMRQGMACGANAYFSKPCDFDALLGKVRTLLENNIV